MSAINWGNSDFDHRIVPTSDAIPQGRGHHIIAKSNIRVLRVVERIMSMMSALTSMDEPHLVIGYTEGFLMGLQMAERDPESARTLSHLITNQVTGLLRDQGVAEKVSEGAAEAMHDWISTILRVMGAEEGPEDEFLPDDPGFFA